MAKTYAMVLGIILIVLGICGFISPLAPSGNLFGVFAVSTANNLVFLAIGIIGLLTVAGGEKYTALYAKVVGVLFGLVTVLGFMVGEGDVLGFMTVNQADNVLNLAIAASALYTGFVSSTVKSS